MAPRFGGMRCFCMEADTRLIVRKVVRKMDSLAIVMRVGSDAKELDG